jgi:hypothetical protein
MRTVCGFLDQEIKPETHTQTQISAPPHHHQKDHAILNPSPPPPLLEKKLLPFQLDYHLRPPAAAAAAAHPGNIPKHLAS